MNTVSSIALYTKLSDPDCLIHLGTEGTAELTLADARYTAEVYSPDAGAGEWCTVAPMTHRSPPIPRMYHSTAALLPDGKVLVAGGEVNADIPGTGCPQPSGAGIPTGGSNCLSGDFYKPPYLFRSNNVEITDGYRPTISTYAGLVGTGTSFTVTLSSLGIGASVITRACFVRPAAVTHGFDMDQRYVPLGFSPNGTLSYGVSAPRSPFDAPPGYYMMFLMNDADGVGHPSIAKFVRVWSILQNSITHSDLVISDANQFEITLTWESPLAAQSGCGARFYPPSLPDGPPVGGAVVQACAHGSDGRHHQARFRVTGCELNYWYYEVLSGTTSPASVSQSLKTERTKFKVKVCLE